MDTPTSPSAERLRANLSAADASVRLEAAMAAGAGPGLDLLPSLIARCAVEDDFYVREMLTWAIIQRPAPTTVPLLREELSSATNQARSQALHTLSKIGTPESWPWIFPDLLTDQDDEVARAAWRLAVRIVPREETGRLLELLISQLGRGSIEALTSLARALVDLSCLDDAVVARLQDIAETGSGLVAAHAAATLVVVEDPGASFAGAMAEAGRSR